MASTPLVSVITPTYQSQHYIGETIKTVQNQTYPNWEMLIADDGSTDNTRLIVSQAAKQDNRIRLIPLLQNGGAAKARNAALSQASGKYIAYLDADDLWASDKLEKQVHYMQERNCAFSCTSYQIISDGGKRLNKVISMMPCLDYKGYLLNNLIQTVGVMVDRGIVPGKLLEMPNMRRRQDAATWMQILKAGFPCYGIMEPLAFYRRSKGSLSSNKWGSVSGTWKLYYSVEQLPFSFACRCFLRYAVLAIWKRLYFPKQFRWKNKNYTKTESRGGIFNERS